MIDFRKSYHDRISNIKRRETFGFSSLRNLLWEKQITNTEGEVERSGTEPSGTF